MKISFKRKVIIRIKRVISKIVLFFLYRGIRIVTKLDGEAKKEVETWKDRYTINIKTCKNGPNLIIKKVDGKIKRIKDVDNCNLEIIFKSLDSAFLLLTGRLGIAQAYAEHRFMLKGNIIEAMSLVRCLDIVEMYLFPKIISKNLVKEVKKRKVPMLIVYLRIIINF